MRAGNANAFSPKCVAPLHSAKVPLSQRHRLRLDHQVHLKAGVLAANLRALPVEDDPEPSTAEWLIGELEPDHHAVVRKSVPLDVPLAPRPEHDVGIDVLRSRLLFDVGPAITSEFDARSMGSRSAPRSSWIVNVSWIRSM